VTSLRNTPGPCIKGRAQIIEYLLGFALIEVGYRVNKRVILVNNHNSRLVGKVCAEKSASSLSLT
jgi:hypothetical protein